MSITLTKEISISVMTLIIGCLLGMGGASTSLAIEIPAPVASAPANSPSATDASEELNDAKNFAFNEIEKAEVEEYIDGRLATLEVILNKTMDAVSRGRGRLAGANDKDVLSQLADEN